MGITQSTEASDNLSRSELWNQLQNALSSRLGIEQVYWSSYSMFWATNAVLLVALFSADNLFDKLWVPIVTSIAGLVQFFTWKTIQDRVLGHLERVEVLILRIEEDIGLRERHALSLRLSGTDYRGFISKGYSTRRAVQFSIFFIGISWGLLLIYSIYRGFVI